MKVLMPVAGESSRFPGMKPKWLLTHPNGNLMFHEALAGLDLSQVDEILIVCRQDHAERFAVAEAVRRQFEASDIGVPYRLAAIAPTSSQPETVAAGLRAFDVEGPVLIKDSDNRFHCRVSPGNAVATLNLRDAGLVVPSNKSYVELDGHDRVVNIVEKHVISDTFCVGGYGFARAEEFLRTYERIQDVEGLYVSHVIYEMISAGEVFHNLPVDNFHDWGTVADWNRYKRTYATLFVDLDGTVVSSSGRFFEPLWGQTGALPNTVAALNRLQEAGRIQLIITTSRAESFRAATEAQLRSIGLRYDQILFGLSHSRRIVINDYADTNPYKSADAINVPRDSGTLAQLLRDFFEDHE